MRALLGLTVMVPLLLGAGCQRPACAPGSVLVSLRYAGLAIAADTLEVTITVEGAALTRTSPRTPGLADRVALTFGAGGYPAGQPIALHLRALAGSTELAVADDDFTAEPSCTARSLTLGSPELDAAGPRDDGGDADASAGPDAGDDAGIPALDGGDDAGSAALDGGDLGIGDLSPVADLLRGPDLALTHDSPAPAGFWDASNLPAAKNIVEVKFLNRSNGALTDGQIYWRLQQGSINELHSLAEKSTFDLPAASGRMYFYLCPTGETSCDSDPTLSKYNDFIELNVETGKFTGDTSRVDAFGIKLAMLLHCSDGFELAVGEDYYTFAEDRTATFSRFVASVPAEFKPLAQAPYAPYRIIEPGAGGFGSGGAYATYYDAWVDQLWAQNGITIAKPGPNASGLSALLDLQAAIFRHVGAVAGAFRPDGTLLDQTLWSNAATFYQTAPYNAYAKFWHDSGIGRRATAFAADYAGAVTAYVSHASPTYLLVAIGW